MAKNSQLKASNPGPGSYELKGTLSNISTTMISRRRDLSQEKSCLNPGPGNYNPKLLRTKLAMRFKTASRDVTFNQNPGPGQYQPKLLNRPRSATYKSNAF